MPGATRTIVKPERKPHVGTGYAFRSYKFAEARIRRPTGDDDQWACRKPDCRQMFPTRNKLFAHLREQLHFSRSIVPICQITPGTTTVIVKLERKPYMGTGYAFHGYKFAEARIRPSASAEDKWWDRASFPADVMADPILDDIRTPEIIAPVDDIKYGLEPDLTLDQLQQLKDLVVRHRKKITSSINDIKFGLDLTPDQLLELKEFVKRSWEKTDGYLQTMLRFFVNERHEKVIKPGMKGRKRGRRMCYPLDGTCKGPDRGICGA